MSWSFTANEQYNEIWRTQYKNVTILDSGTRYIINRNGIMNCFNYYDNKRICKNIQIIKTYNDGTKSIIYDAVNFKDIDRDCDLFPDVDYFDVDDHENTYIARVTKKFENYENIYKTRVIEKNVDVLLINSKGEINWTYKLPDNSRIVNVIAFNNKVFVYTCEDLKLFLWIFDIEGVLLEKRIEKIYEQEYDIGGRKLQCSPGVLFKKIKGFVYIVAGDYIRIYDCNGNLKQSCPNKVTEQPNVIREFKNSDEQGYYWWGWGENLIKRISWAGETMWEYPLYSPGEYLLGCSNDMVFILNKGQGLPRKISVIEHGFVKKEVITENIPSKILTLPNDQIGMLFTIDHEDHSMTETFVSFSSDLEPLKEYRFEELIKYLEVYEDKLYGYMKLSANKELKRGKKNIGFMLQ